MTWRGVPWAVGPDVPQARTLAYYAGRGDEGVGAPGDCAVVAADVPDDTLTVRPGVVGMLARYAGGAGQAYVAQNTDEAPETVTVTPTGAGVTRRDLIAVIVEDPAFAGQPDPPDPALGPYVRTVVYEGVPVGTEKLADVDADQAGLALALVTLPPSTSTVLPEHLTDLRRLPAARSARETRLLTLPDVADVNLVSGAYVRFPTDAGWDVDVPWWAVRAILEVTVTGTKVSNDSDPAGSWDGRARARLGTLTPEDETWLWPPAPPADTTIPYSFVVGGTVDVPAAMRGTTQTLEVQAYRVENTGNVQLARGRGTSVLASVTFLEDVSIDTFEA